jgi:hypothetical protein
MHPPQEPGALGRGIPTAQSAPVLNDQIVSNEIYVWPYVSGNVRGQAILPFYPNQVHAVLQDDKLYDILALIDSIRVCKVREKDKAMDLLKKYFDQ